MEAFRVYHTSSSSPSAPPSKHGQAPAAALLDCEHMFDKVVTPSDVGKLNRLVIPKQYAERFLPLNSSLAVKGIIMSFEDRAGKQWCFRYCYWNSSQSYVMTKGWSRFVREKQLAAGDTVSFLRSAGKAGQDRLFIDLQHRPPLPITQFSLTGRPVGQWSGLIASSLYYRSACPRHVGVQAEAGSSDTVSMPLVSGSVPVVFGAAKPKQLRLFGVNLEWPDAEGSSNSQSSPSLQPPRRWSTGGAESTH
ncbi:hypothetical protein OPV22_024855 [Ensete ventricosum]|uniref:TF-B3 domain-containing protein n=1 Tax=Ensete ventricosum TaxID=4639 RepID=A0AAV8Q686_ENSVE|nr:hypothetical protein OPV22_024855 [Ensete ventricosum]RWW33757.1 hypothetical protein GW17_00001520 [Ensete ventricosum]RWW40591.1 hypothetical protein BHE74_00053984 [Ensete ventricosum]